jgi:radical SAM superfamily enzyme YgiQ (UPF0313 family)
LQGEITHIIFVYPPASSAADEGRRTRFDLCLGSAYLIAYLQQQGYKARQFITTGPVSVKESAARIAALKPGAVGFTVDYANYFFCQFIARALKEIEPRIIIIFGGIVPTVHSRAVLENNPWVDLCSRNESEETCLELLRQLETVNFKLEKVALEKVKGIDYQRDGQIHHTPDRQVIAALKSLPGALDRYPSPYLQGVATSARLGILTARGCNQSCTYCMCPVLSHRGIATHSPDRVIQELDYISTHWRNHGRGIVDIFDDTFTLLPRRVLEICRKIKENKIKISLACTTRCDRVNEEMLSLMKEAGFQSVEFSLESAVPRLLRIIGKVQPPDTPADPHFEKEREFIEKFKKYVRYAKEIGIEKVYTSIMLGLPTETPAEGRQTVKLIRSLSQYIDFYGHNILRAHPGTPLFYNSRKYGIQIEMQQNRVHAITIPSYPARQIPPAPNSSIEITGINQDQDNIKTLAFCLSLPKKEKPEHPYVNKVILQADRLTGEFISWLRQSMAINGTLIQLYSGLAAAKRHYRDNENALLTHRAPTNYYAGYYQTHPADDDGILTLTPCRTYISGKRCGITLHLVPTALGLRRPGGSFEKPPPGPPQNFLLENSFLNSTVLPSSLPLEINPFHTLGIDRPGEKQDVLHLHRELTLLSRSEQPLLQWVDRPLYPYIGSLCRWEHRPPNCRVLETLLVDTQQHIKTCWNGTPIGNVGMPLPEIRENLNKLHWEAETKRDCTHCPGNTACSRCIFPCPLTEQEFCHLKQAAHVEKAAELMRMSDLIKEVGADTGIYHADSL